MAMEDEERHTAVVTTDTTASNKGGDVGESGACIDRQPDTVVQPAGLNQTAGRGSRIRPGAPAATGIRVLKRNMKRNGSRGCVTRKTRFGSRERDWLKGDTKRGCLCLYGGTVDPQPSASTPQTDLQLVLCSTSTTVEELCAQRDGRGLYVQLHGDLLRRLDSSERPLQILYDYLASMGYADAVRVQQEAANSDLSCLIRFYSEHPVNPDQQERTLLKGVFSVRKGKTQLHKWAERKVILCGTCLIVASVKDSLTGKLHILPLVGGKVEEVKRRQHCLMFSSAGSQAQTYFVNFDTLTDFQRWHRQASKVVSQTVSMVDLSCYSLEAVPEYLFYCQDITHLNLRHNFMSVQGPGGLLNLPRFSQLKSLNLSHNRLGVFPECVCDIVTLTELNLSCNNIHTVPLQTGNLHSLQTLCLDGNHLSSLPDELGVLSQLSSLGLSFNSFSHVPVVLERLSAVDKLAMAGNRVETLELCSLARMSHVKNIDLRLNGLRRVKSESLEAVTQLTQLDLRDNCLHSLDLSSICNLETLHCQRNQLGALTLSGFTLRMLHASSNRLTTVNVYPVPNQLTYMELSQNLLEYLPDWVCDCRKIEMLDITHNLLSELPSRLFNSLSLRKLLAGNNCLQRVPDLLDHVPLEALDLQHNKLTQLPESLFYKALNLKSLNVSANSLESIPPSSQSEESLSTLQELYLSGNNLNENCGALLAGHHNLRVLHVAYNQMLSFPASKLSKLELLEELNLSGNKLKTIPSTVSSCKRLHTLIAHSNHVTVFPEILNLPEIKLVDLSCNELTEIQLPDSLPPTLQELDLTGNSGLMLEHKTLNLFSHITTLKLDQKCASTAGDSLSVSTPWNHGYSEMSGQRNKLCVSVLTVDHFGDGVEACYGIFDGDRNEEVPRLLQCTMGDVLCEELQHSSVDRVYMCNTFLTSHRKLGMAGQKLGASALLCYVHRNLSDPGGSLSLTVANVGTCQAVLCRDGRPVPLSKVYSLENCVEEMERVKLSKAIITEDNKVSGVTCCSRLLGCSYLSPWVLPKPWVQTEPLCVQDKFLILGNRALFEWVSYQEAVCTVQAVGDPRAAAKKLCTLAQSYGCKDNIGAVVVSLHVGEDSCTCEPTVVSAPEPRAPPPAPAPVTVTPGPGDAAALSSSSGVASEFNSETSASEVGSEAGSTASDEQQSSGLAPRPERRCSLHPATSLCGIMVPGSAGAGPHPGLFQRQPSCATFSSNQSDNGLDSDDEAPLEGVISNGSRLEVEVDIHCCAFQLRSASSDSSRDFDSEKQSSDFGSARTRRQNSVVVSATNGCLLAVCGREIADLKKSPSTSSLFVKKLSNGSVVAPEDSHNLIEVALEAPKKKSGYFTAPAQQDPEDQLIVPPSLEQEVREQLRGQSPAPSSAPVWDHPHPPVFTSNLVPGPGPTPILQQEVYDTAL
ncbi:PH domain leucine-rich repeat-containing protein phosphatase 2 isoform X1 [Solea senegalensis]|uniref:PH domain leucine-rich repeat-containing protein phosphatase 2 n=1 Tax=Solea senegalensis TaxID=28829 RepID=A0AAV6Q2R3_SOLSE|nr:PH domain leucine-rich repeat-containing protein phosphatase 2 isoform X2 [Solea senegalensis]KAG7482661.1 PH domain leucine-rich repeat-containing protein phosphatase 2 isoform X1 [Solea senegalensis]